MKVIYLNRIHPERTGSGFVISSDSFLYTRIVISEIASYNFLPNISSHSLKEANKMLMIQPGQAHDIAVKIILICLMDIVSKMSLFIEYSDTSMIVMVTHQEK